MKQSIDVKALADVPGFGKAAEIIRQTLDPEWGLSDADGKVNYCVVIEYSRREEDEEHFDVRAATEAEAIEQAKKLFREAYGSYEVELECARVER